MSLGSEGVQGEGSRIIVEAVGFAVLNECVDVSG